MKKLFAAAAVCFLLCLVSVQAGYMYNVETSVTSMGEQDPAMVVKVCVDGKKGRIDFDKGGPQMQGGYVVTTDGGQTLHLVNPDDKTYMVWDMDEMMASLGAVTEMLGGMVDMKVSDPKVEELGKKKGPKMHGMNTTQYSFRTSYAMEMKIFGMSSRTSVVQDQEIWATQDVQDEALGIWNQQSVKKTGQEQIDKLLAAEMSKVKGLQLKSITKSRETDKNGRTKVTETLMEVTDFKKMDLADKLFEIPPDFKETSMLEAAQSDDAEGEDDEGAERTLPFLKFLKRN